MKFSVLMSVYNGDIPAYLDEAIASLFNQSLLPTELLIVVDGPINKELKEVLTKWRNDHSEIVVVTLPDNVGLAKALNAGIGKCKYEYIARMDSDDICARERFEKQFGYLASHPEISLLGSWYKQYDKTMSKLVTERKVPEEHQAVVEYAKHRTPINHVTIVFKKSDVLSVGGYPEREGRFEDWWLSLTLIKRGYKLHNLPLYLVDVRGGEDFIRRRGGFQYLVQGIKNMYSLQSEKLISFQDFFVNVCVRMLVRLAPNFLREYSYRLIRKI